MTRNIDKGKSNEIILYYKKNKIDYIFTVVYLNSHI